MLVTKELIAPEMSCMHCKAAIENSVKGLMGISTVNADPATKKIVVEFDESATTIDDIRNRIQDAGYSAVEMVDEVS